MTIAASNGPERRLAEFSFAVAPVGSSWMWRRDLPSWKTGRSHSSLFKSGSSGCIVHMSACRRPPRSSLRTKCMVKPSVALPRACTHKIGHPCPLSRDPRIPQACIMFALLRVVCFLRPRCAPGSRFPCGLALGSHLVLFPFRPLASTILRPPRIYWELVSLTFPCGRKNRGVTLAPAARSIGSK